MKTRTEVLNRIVNWTTAALAALAVASLASAPAAADTFFFSTGNADGQLGALSRRPSPGKIETETADDFVLQKTTAITQATITGLISAGAPLPSMINDNVEVEFYHIFPLDSDTSRSPNVPSRTNSPSDVEIDSATRDGSLGTLAFRANLLDANFSVLNTVVNGINKAPNNTTHGEGPLTGQEVVITINFTTPIILPAGHYFLRPEVLLAAADANFLYLSAPRPIKPPGIVLEGDLQAWIRNSNLAPDWLRIGTDIIVGTPPGIPPTFNMTFSLSGATIPEAGTPGAANCVGKTVSALAHQFGSIHAASLALRASSVAALLEAVRLFSEP